MSQDQMTIKILLPTKVFGHYTGVRRLIIETTAGSYGVLPNRLDYAAALAPGILEYENNEGVHYIATGSGIAVKTGYEVLISVHNAYGNGSLGELRQKIKEELMEEEEDTIGSRSVLARMESSFIRNIQHLKHL